MRIFGLAQFICVDLIVSATVDPVVAFCSSYVIRKSSVILMQCNLPPIMRVLDAWVVGFSG